MVDPIDFVFDQQAYDTGREACDQGLKQTSNPRKKGTDAWRSWDQGWHDEDFSQYKTFGDVADQVAERLRVRETPQNKPVVEEADQSSES